MDSLAELFSWRPADLIRAGEMARPLVAHFHEYLLRGGFPQTALIESLSMAQKLLRGRRFRPVRLAQGCSLPGGPLA